MSLLTPQDRAYILEQLTLAPDSVLADAMLAFNAIRDKIVEVRMLAGATGAKPVAAEPVNTAPESRPNVTPGPSTISKIGAETKTSILLALSHSAQPSARYAEHLKLLWSRGEVKFDGKEYWL